jgi:hypothetical protein
MTRRLSDLSGEAPRRVRPESHNTPSYTQQQKGSSTGRADVPIPFAFDSLHARPHTLPFSHWSGELSVTRVQIVSTRSVVRGRLACLEICQSACLPFHRTWLFPHPSNSPRDTLTLVPEEIVCDLLAGARAATAFVNRSSSRFQCGEHRDSRQVEVPV